MKYTAKRGYGPLTLNLAGKRVPIEAVVKPMVPSNEFLSDPPRLRKELDLKGYLYFKGIVQRSIATTGANDLEQMMLTNNWTSEELAKRERDTHGVAWGIIAPRSGILPVPKVPFQMTPGIINAACGTPVMALVRSVFGGPVVLLPHHQLELSYPGERHGFSMPHVFMSRGTKLIITAWVPLIDVALRTGPLVVVAGSNHSEKWAAIRRTYGQHDVEYDGIAGDGSFTHDVDEVMSIGDTELHTSSFEAGDVVLTTCYTMSTFAVNESRQWRISVTSRWMMEGDDVGPDPRYRPGAEGLTGWARSRHDKTKYPLSMEDAKKKWSSTSPDSTDYTAA